MTGAKGSPSQVTRSQLRGNYGAGFGDAGILLLDMGDLVDDLMPRMA
jgi:hypothetical protein